VVDWRGSDFLRDKSVNLFAEYFETPSEIQGVPIAYAPSLDGEHLDALEPEALTLELWQARAQLTNPADARVLVLSLFHGYDRLDPTGDAFEQFRRLREFFRVLRPKPFVQAEVDRFAHAHRFDDSFVVTVNVATGNGIYDKGGPFERRVNTRIFADERRFLRKASAARARTLRRLPEHVRNAAVTFVATDSAFMRNLLLRLPNAVTRRDHFPPPGSGRGFADYETPGYDDRAAFLDILVDHFLLARCNAAVRNASMFGTYGLVTTDFYNGNFVDIESLYARYWLRAARRRLSRLPSR